MGSAARLVRGEQQKQIVKLIEGMEGRRSAWEIWQDFIVMSALAISNSVDRENRETREREYMRRAEQYTREELEQFPAMLALTVDAMEENPDQDFLGDLFMSLGLGDQWKGQFFTPYCICKSMEDMKREFEIAVEDLEEIMFKGGGNIDTCAYCRNDRCYVRGGRDCCNPIWRGRDNPSVTAKP